MLDISSPPIFLTRSSITNLTEPVRRRRSTIIEKNPDIDQETSEYSVSALDTGFVVVWWLSCVVLLYNLSLFSTVSFNI